MAATQNAQWSDVSKLTLLLRGVSVPLHFTCLRLLAYFATTETNNCPTNAATIVPMNMTKTGTDQ